MLVRLTGQTSLCGETEWVHYHREVLAQRFGLPRKRMPCQMTYCNIFAIVDAKRLDEILSAFFQRWEAQNRCGEEPSRLLTPEGKADHHHLAIEGKALPSTSKQAHPVHKILRQVMPGSLDQLICYEVATGRILWHCNVQEKHNEISELKPLLTTQTVK